MDPMGVRLLEYWGNDACRCFKKGTDWFDIGMLAELNAGHRTKESCESIHGPCNGPWNL